MSLSSNLLIVTLLLPIGLTVTRAADHAWCIGLPPGACEVVASSQSGPEEWANGPAQSGAGTDCADDTDEL